MSKAQKQTQTNTQTPKQPQKQNKASEKAGLTMNVNAIKKAIKAYYKSQSIEFSKVSGGNIAMASMLESMARIIIEKCEKEVAFNKSGLREVTREGMNSALLRNSNEYGYFIIKANDFVEKFDYSKFLPIDKEMEKIYSEHKNVSFSLEAKNYMYYLLYTVFTNIALTCAKLLTFSGIKSVNGKCIVCAVEIEFPKSISTPLMKNINEALRLNGETLEGKGDDDSGDDKNETGTGTVEDGDGDDNGDENGDDNGDEPEAEAPEQKTKSQKNAKASTPTTTPTPTVTQTQTQTQTQKTKAKGADKPVEKSSPKTSTTSTQAQASTKKGGAGNKPKLIEVEDDADDQDDEQKNAEETVKTETKKKDSKKPVTPNKSKNNK
jgi:hypothetical protein